MKDDLENYCFHLSRSQVMSQCCFLEDFQADRMKEPKE